MALKLFILLIFYYLIKYAHIYIYVHLMDFIAEIFLCIFLKNKFIVNSNEML